MRSRLSRPILCAVLLSAVLVGISVFAQGAGREQRFRLRWKQPSLLARQFAVLGGTSGGPRLLMTPEDDSRTLVVRYDAGSASILQEQQLQYILEDAVERMDTEEKTVTVELGVVRTSLLDERQYVSLDEKLRAEGIPHAEGLTHRGLIFRKRFELRPFEITEFRDTQSEARGQTQTDPTSSNGGLLARWNHERGGLHVSFDLTVTASEEELFANGKTIRVAQRVELRPDATLVIAAGAPRPFQELQLTFPGRNELMIYLRLVTAPKATPEILYLDKK